MHFFFKLNPFPSSANFIVDPLLNVLEDYAAYFTPTIASTIGIEIDDMNIERLTKTVVELMKELWDIIDTVEVEDIGFSFSDKSDPCFEDVDWTEWSSCDNSVCEETRYKCADNITEYFDGNCTDVIMETRVCEDDSFCDQDDDSWSDWGVCNNTECKQSRFKCSDYSTNYDSCDPEIEKKDCDNSAFCDQDDDAWSDWGVCDGISCTQERYKCSDHSTNYTTCYKEIQTKVCDDDSVCYDEAGPWGSWGLCNNTVCTMNRHRCGDKDCSYEEFDTKRCKDLSLCGTLDNNNFVFE